MHLISLLLGLVIAWGILFFIGPRKRVVSYYVQAPVVGMPISEIDSAMEAVGLASSDWKGQAEGPSPAPAPVPEPEPSVADIAVKEEAPSLGDQDTQSMLQAYSPSPSPSQ
jgi:hypothetical protein